VKSFDAWDTLIARRSVADQHNETGNVFPIAENVAKVEPGDIITSDYYDEDLLKQLIPAVTGLTNRVIVTEDGKISGRIWKLLPGVTEHLDDNVNVLRKVHEAGIVRRLTTLSDFTKNEAALMSVFPNLAKTMREARLSTWHADPLQRQRQLAQIEANFPMLYLASLLLQKQLTDQTVLMSSRDCLAWFVLQSLIAARTGAKYQVKYFFTSRVARAFPSPAYLAAVNELLPNSVIVDLCGTGWSLSRLLERTSYPNTPIWFLLRYNYKPLEQEYQRIGRINLLNINELTQTSLHPNLERINLADHPMTVDIHDGKPEVWNPCNIDWQMPEIKVQQEAFGSCLRAAEYYPLHLDATEQQIQDALEQTFKWIGEYEPALAFATKFLQDEDRAVMKELECRKSR
jgi:hypothetical protein